MKNLRNYLHIIALVLLLVGTYIFTNGQTPDEVRTIQPNETLTREMTGKATHQYKFDLKKDEFFQVRVEQKGLDVSLKLTDGKGNVLAEMDSPNGKEGFEILTFVADKNASFVLEIISPNEKAEKGTYILKREDSRTVNEKDKRRVEVEKIFVEATKLLGTNYTTSFEKYEIALKGWQELNDEEMINFTKPWVDFAQINAVHIEVAYKNLNQASQAITDARSQNNVKLLDNAKEYLNRANENFKRVEQLAKEFLSKYPEDVGNRFEVKNYFYHAKVGEHHVAGNFVNLYTQLLEDKETLKYSKIAFSYAKEANSMETIGINEDDKLQSFVIALADLANAAENNRLPETFEYYENFVENYRKLNSIKSKNYSAKNEARFLSYIATLYSSKLCKESLNICSRKSINYREKAISIFVELNDNEGLAGEYAGIGNSYFNLDEYFTAFEFTEKSISRYRNSDNKEQLAFSLIGNASIYLALGNTKKSKEYQNEALSIFLSITKYQEGLKSEGLTPFIRNNYLVREYLRLNIIGGIYLARGDKQCIEYYSKVIELAKLLSDINKEADSISLIGRYYGYYSEIKDWKKAQLYYEKSRNLYQQTDNKRNIAGNLVDIALVNLELNKPKLALQNLSDAQLIYSSIGAKDWGGLNKNLARTWDALGNRQMAIFYGKKLVDYILTEREKLKSFDLETQQSYIKSFDKGIRRLADWLIEDGQFAEAERVLRLLKEEEFADFVKRDANEIKNLKTNVNLTDAEKKAIEKYNQLSDEVSKIGQEFYQLEQKDKLLRERGLKLNEEDEKLYRKLGDDLKVARDAFEIFLDKELVKEIGEAKKKDVENLNKNRKNLGKLPVGTVTLYTVVGENRYRVILTTPNGQVDGKYEIKAENLNKKVFAFREALQNPNVDPRPLGKELYDILIKPIEKDLKNSKAKTLLWFLDGTLRYIPLATLSPDGKKYLVEDFQNVVLTAKTANLTQPNTNNDWKVLGMGVSNVQKVDHPIFPNEKIEFDPLPGTKRELTSIVSDESLPNEIGVLPGKRFLDEQFTFENFEDSLRERKFNVVHLASHFYLGNNADTSFLLLGNDKVLALKELNNSSFIDFDEIDLVTLSACNTAFSNDSNGSEVDSLADIVQTQSGTSVLATLWSVADESTAILMSEFYRIKKENPNLTKAEAMQMAQRKMIQGEYKTIEEATKRGVETFGQENETKLPLFEKDDKAPFAHPYYWSPFVLIGNWK